MEGGLVLLFDITNLFFYPFDKLVHMAHFAPDLVVDIEAGVYFFGLVAEAIGEPLDFDTGSHGINGCLYVFLPVFELFHMDHHIPDFIVGIFYCGCDILVIVHQLRNHIQLRQILLVELQLIYILAKVFATAQSERIHVVDELIEKRCPFLCIHQIVLI